MLIPLACPTWWRRLLCRHSHSMQPRSADPLVMFAGGDLRLVSMPGYGVDAYLSIQYLEGQWEESRVEPQTDPISNGGDAVALP